MQFQYKSISITEVAGRIHYYYSTSRTAYIEHVATNLDIDMYNNRI